jgi:hypothetical protein
VVAFTSDLTPPSDVVAIQGNEKRVWLLGVDSSGCSAGISSLYESDGKLIRLAKASVCVDDEQSCFSPRFDTLELKGDTLELLGTSAGGCGVATMLAEHKGDGSWRCTRGVGEVSAIRRFWSSGELTSVNSSFAGAEFESFGALNTELSPIRTPLAVTRGGAHAWALVGGQDNHAVQLLEWTGLRWRERADVLPAGVSADDIVALTVDDEGTYYLTTQDCLLVFDRTRFVAHAAPRGLTSELLVATKAYGLWALGGARAWHYEPRSWSYAELPLADVDSAWLAPDGTLWIAGTGVARPEQRDSGEATPSHATVVTLSLPEATNGRSP